MAESFFPSDVYLQFPCTYKNSQSTLSFTSTHISLSSSISSPLTFPLNEFLGLTQTSETSLKLLFYNISAKSPKFSTYEIISPLSSKIESCISNLYHYKKKFLVIINPISGRGSGIKIWEKVKSMFECCDLDVKLTEYRGHAKVLIQNLYHSEYTSVIAIGGDGLVHEIVNGMLQDCQEKFKLPIAVISAGSGNALAQYVCSKISKKLTPENCAYISLKGQAQDFDITKISYETGKILYSFLSLSWGYIADVDIESDIFRCCGVMRYDFYGAWRLLVLRRYTGMIKWEGQESGCQEGNFVYFWSCNIPYVGEDMKVAPLAHENDGFNDLLIVGNVSRFALCRLLLTQDSGRHISNPNLKHFKSTSWTLKPDRGIFSIDGDEYPIGNISAQVLHSIGSFTMLS